MFHVFKSIWTFLNYWYFRYLMVTELYMVEKWERAVCNITILTFVCFLSYFNYTMLYYTSAAWNHFFSNTSLGL